MFNTHNKKILVVDDEEEILTYLTKILKRANYEVISTTKGKEAIELTRNLHPDLIILDILLPDISGSEVACVLSENSSTTEIPIIFLTAIVEKGERSNGGKTGKHYVLAKPVEVENLLELIKKTLSH